jgi:hypothetical protein
VSDHFKWPSDSKGTLGRVDYDVAGVVRIYEEGESNDYVSDDGQLCLSAKGLDVRLTCRSAWLPRDNCWRRLGSDS